MSKQLEAVSVPTSESQLPTPGTLTCIYLCMSLAQLDSRHYDISRTGVSSCQSLCRKSNSFCVSATL